jgi:hypothetical protein
MTDDPPVKGSSVRAYCFEQNKSHFDESLKGQTFCQRYSVNATSYQPGGPIIVFDPGESSADGL